MLGGCKSGTNFWLEAKPGLITPVQKRKCFHPREVALFYDLTKIRFVWLKNKKNFARLHMHFLLPGSMDIYPIYYLSDIYLIFTWFKWSCKWGVQSFIMIPKSKTVSQRVKKAPKIPFLDSFSTPSILITIKSTQI